MKDFYLNKGLVLLLIHAEDKRQIFELDVLRESGDTVSITKELKAGPVEDQYFSQSVQFAEVIRVADDITHIQPGDMAMLDYLADADANKIAYQDERGKYIVLPVLTDYYQEDLIAYASMNTRTDVYTWRKGDPKNISWIYAVLRNGVLIPNTNYIILEHRNFTWEAQKQEIFYHERDGDMVIRKVLAVRNHTDIVDGDFVYVNSWEIYERSIGNKNFDIVMQHDIVAKL